MWNLRRDVPILVRLLLWGVVAAALIVVSGCGTAGGGKGPAAGSTSLQVSMRDFHIKAPEHVSTGDVVLSVRNKGPERHELIVVRLGRNRLPLRRDGLTIDEEELEPVKIGGLEPFLPGAVRKLRLHLAPGRYMLFCNMYGHYLGGMHAELVVS